MTFDECLSHRNYNYWSANVEIAGLWLLHFPVVIVSVLLISLSVAMDAFAVSIAKGLAMHRVGLRECTIPGLWFGGFQGGMTLLGALIGNGVASSFEAFSGPIAFVLLAFIGVGMIREAIKGEAEEEGDSASLGWRPMLGASIATSIDALAIGAGLGITGFNIPFTVASIALVTMAMSMLGVAMGSKAGSRWEKPAQIVGGVILIGIGVKLLLGL